MNLNKLDSNLKKNQEIKDFKVFDTDMEWNLFLEKVENQNSDGLDSHKKENKVRLSVLSAVRAVAAILLLVLVFFIALKEPEKTRAIVTASENKNIELSDGSIISLTKGAKVDYPIHFRGQKERKIILDGKATFDVRNSILPFNVYSKDLKIEVLGTKFIISRQSDTSFVENIEGVVKVSEIKNPDNAVILYKGDKFHYAGGVFKNMNYTESIEKDTGKAAENIRKKEARSNTEPEIITEPAKPEGSIYTLGSVLKDYLVKQNKKLIKIDKKFKFDSEQRVRVNLAGSYNEIIKSLKSQGIIATKQGDCPECIIIIAPGSGK